MKLSLRDVVAKVLTDIVCIEERQLDDSFPSSLLVIENCQFPPFRSDKNSKVGSKIV